MTFLTMALILILVSILANKMVQNGAAKKALIPVRIRTRRPFYRSER
jgi:hypothetical protein